MMTYSQKIIFNKQDVKTSLPIFLSKINPNDNILKMAYQGLLEESKKNYPSIQSNVKSKFTSSWFSHKENYKFVPLVNFIESCCNEIIKTFFKQDWTVECLNCWGSFYEKDDFTVKHNHIPNFFGVCVYLDLEENSSNIVFEDTEIPLEKGTIIIFPGVLNHQVLPTKGKRVVVAMNLNKKS